MDVHNDNSLPDAFLSSLRGIKPAEPTPFFYTRLKARMQFRYEAGKSFSMPQWAIGLLFLLLITNTWMIIQKENMKQQMAEKKSPVVIFAETYNLKTDSNY